VTTDTASITGNYSQYAMGVQLTDGEMDRLVRYMNAGSTANAQNYSTGKTTVFGFYNSRKQKVTDIRCTNWATSAPIGELPRWARTIDRRITKNAEAGGLLAQGVPEILAAGGLHAALAQAATPEARADVVRRLVAVPGMSKWNKSAVRRMAKAFKKELADFPSRPADLVLRQSLAQTLGLNRSQDPAKWSFDLLVSKRVPVVAVLNGTRDAGLAQKLLNWEIMGSVDAAGTVVANSYQDYSNPNAKNLGVVPPEKRLPTPRRPRPQQPAQPAGTP
jgi:hypothetical protein